MECVRSQGMANWHLRGRGSGYRRVRGMRKHKGPLVKVKTKNGPSLFYTRNEIGFAEVCALDETGQPELPILKMDPQQQTGSIEFRSTSDSFSGGNASAGAAYTRSMPL